MVLAPLSTFASAYFIFCPFSAPFWCLRAFPCVFVCPQRHCYFPTRSRSLPLPSLRPRRLINYNFNMRVHTQYDHIASWGSYEKIEKEQIKIKKQKKQQRNKSRNAMSSSAEKVELNKNNTCLCHTPLAPSFEGKIKLMHRGKKEVAQTVARAQAQSSKSVHVCMLKQRRSMPTPLHGYSRISIIWRIWIRTRFSREGIFEFKPGMTIIRNATATLEFLC